MTIPVTGGCSFCGSYMVYMLVRVVVSILIMMEMMIKTITLRECNCEHEEMDTDRSAATQS